MKSISVLILSLSLALIACAQPKKKGGGEDGSGSRGMSGQDPRQILLAAESGSREAAAAIAETESQLNENRMNETAGATTGRTGRTGTTGRAGDESEPGGNTGANTGSEAGATNSTGTDSGSAAGDRDNNRDTAGGRPGVERGGPGPGGNSGSAAGADGSSDLGDIGRGTAGGSREASRGSGPEAEVVEEDAAGSGNSGRERERALMEVPGMEREGDSATDRERSARNRRNNSSASGPGEEFDPDSFEKEIKRAERQAVAAAGVAGGDETEAERAERNRSDSRSDDGSATGRRRTERRMDGSDEAARDGESDSADGRDARETARRTIVSGSQNNPEERVKTAERETVEEIESDSARARESERATRRHRRTIITDTKKTERTRTAEREDSSELRLNREGTYTDTRGSAIGSQTAARDEAAKSGMIAADTYQVFVTVFGDSKDKAMQQGKLDARLKAYNLLLKEHRGGRRLSERGRRDLRQFINRNGKVTDVSKQSENSWNVTLQIKNPRLRSFLKKLR